MSHSCITHLQTSITKSEVGIMWCHRTHNYPIIYNEEVYTNKETNEMTKGSEQIRCILKSALLI